MLPFLLKSLGAAKVVDAGRFFRAAPGEMFVSPTADVVARAGVQEGSCRISDGKMELLGSYCINRSYNDLCSALALTKISELHSC